MNNPKGLYNQYKEINQRAADFNHAAAVLEWDQEVYMPRKGFAFRGRQLATLAAQAHELTTSEKYKSLLYQLKDADGLSEEEQRNAALSLEDFEKNSRLPASFIERLSHQTSASYEAWLKARKENDFKIFLPELGRMIALKKEQASLYGFNHHPYNALLDDYEKGAAVAMLDTVFEKVRTQLPPLLEQINNSAQVDDTFFKQHFPSQKQFDFTVTILKQIGYDFEAGRQDYAEHPFSTSFAPTDSRITTRVDEQDLSYILWSSIHEGGHALYEQGLPEAQYGLPLGAAVSLSIHESQSRLWENCVGRGAAFWQFFYPKLQNVFPGQLQSISLQNFYKGMNKVQPSLIRTEADELTYHFHVMIRYEIEKALIEGGANAEDIPAYWKELYQKYLGIAPKDDKTGALQDVHWSHGSFGYFPTYSLGSFYATQFYAKATSEIGNATNQFASGDYSKLLQWLRQNIHCHGRRYNSEELSKRITGEGVNMDYFLSYATEKYKNIYGF